MFWQSSIGMFLLTADELDHVRHTLPEELYRLAFGALTLDAYKEVARANEAEATARKASRDADRGRPHRP